MRASCAMWRELPALSMRERPPRTKPPLPLRPREAGTRLPVLAHVGERELPLIVGESRRETAEPRLHEQIADVEDAAAAKVPCPVSEAYVHGPPPLVHSAPPLLFTDRTVPPTIVRYGT